MDEIAVYVGMGLGLAWIVCVWLRGWLLSTCALAVTVLVYTAGFGQTQAPVRVVLLAFLILGLVAVVAEGSANLNSRVKLGVVTVLAVCCLAFFTGQSLTDDIDADPLFRYTLLYPIAGIAGFVLMRAGKGAIFARIYVGISILMGVLATFERLSGKFLVAGTYESAERLVRDGSIRGIVFSEHPLVLSVLLVASIPLISKVIPWQWLCFLAYAVVIAGIAATNSRGAMVLLLVWLVVRLGSKYNSLRVGFSRALKVLLITGAIAVFIALLFGSGGDQLSSSTAVDASAEYRSTLYNFAVQSLFDRPLGWGISGLPEGTYLAPSYFGTLDISKTVDSELALTIFDFGWPGLIAFAAVSWGLLQSPRLASPYGQAALLVTASGLYLALHAWTGLGTLWWLLAGLAFGSEQQTSSLTSYSPPAKTQRKTPTL
ncbi:O-antigen ligase family protein [Paenarthrobacter nitroguajacolicus]